MQRYIDADAFEADYRKKYCTGCENNNGIKCKACWVDDMLGELDDAPTVSPEEVRGDGRWIHFTRKYISGVDDEGVPMIRCSVCDYTQFESSRSSTNYCPSCGAQMEVTSDAELRDFEKLVKKLRYCSKLGNCNLQCPRFSFAEDCLGKLTTDDADSIEELLAAVPKWVSVEERLPEQGERVLVSNGGFICESYLSQSGKWQRGGVDMFFMTPTHWMPLPKPPKEVE